MDLTAAKRVLGEHFEFIADDADAVIQQLDLPANAAVLDVGTGTGHFAIVAALNGHRVLTGEPASDDSEYARKDWQANARAAGVEHLIEFQPFDAQALPLNDNAFDAVFFFGVLHHINEDIRTRVLREACRVAKPGSPIAFYEPNEAAMARVRQHYPTHPEAADPMAYIEGLNVTTETVKGVSFDTTIFRKH